jgi:hypothetical protein
MGNFPVQDLIPLYPLHWTTILHYLLLIGAIFLLTISGDQATILFTVVLAIFALLVAADLYSQLLEIDRLFIFLMRIVFFALPIIVGGMADVEEVRQLGFLLAVLALPILVMTFLTCWVGPGIGDPRVYGWCSL